MIFETTSFQINGVQLLLYHRWIGPQHRNKDKHSETPIYLYVCRSSCSFLAVCCLWISCQIKHHRIGWTPKLPPDGRSTSTATPLMITILLLWRSSSFSLFHGLMKEMIKHLHKTILNYKAAHYLTTCWMCWSQLVHNSRLELLDCAGVLREARKVNRKTKCIDINQITENCCFKFWQ